MSSAVLAGLALEATRRLQPRARLSPAQERGDPNAQIAATDASRMRPPLLARAPAIRWLVAKRWRAEASESTQQHAMARSIAVVIARRPALAFSASGKSHIPSESEFSSSIQRLTLKIVSPMVLSDILSPAYISLDSSIFNCRWSVDRICIQSSIKSVIAVTIDFSVPSEN
jgi:hypothetical protein